MRIVIGLGPVITLGCSPGPVVATIQLEDGAGDVRQLRVEDDTFHLNGFVSIESDTGEKIELQLAQAQPGRYLTPITVVSGSTMYGQVQVDVDVDWNNSGRFPLTHRVRFVDGTLAAGMDQYTITGGGFTIDNQGCKSSGGLGASLECGQTWAWDDDPGAEIGFPLSGPSKASSLLAELCPDELVEQWLTEATAVMTSGSVDLGAASLKCVTTQSGARSCGDSARGVSADGCDDWRVTWLGYPNATQQNQPFTLLIGAGSECEGASRTCRSEWAGGKAEVR